MKQLHAFVMAIGLSIFNTLMPCGPASAELDTQFNAAGVFSGISGTAEIRFPSGAQLLDLEFRGVVTDADNNIYLGGFLSDIPERFLAYKLTPTGLPIWFTALPEFSAGSSDEANGIAIDQSGCVYLGGFTDPSGATLRRFAAASLDNAGALVWMTALPAYSGNSRDEANGIAVDYSGCVYLGGWTDLDDSFSNSRFAAAKLNDAGTLIWMTALDRLVSSVSSSEDKANSITLDSSGCVYLGGFSTLGVFPFEERFVAAKLDGAGSLIWMTALPEFDSTFPGSADVANGIVVDGTGRVYLGGKTERANAPFLPRFFAAAALSNAGELIWMTALSAFSGSLEDEANGVALDQKGCVYLGGHSDFHFAAVKLDDNGDEIWRFLVPFFSVSQEEAAYDIAVDTKEAVILGGQTEADSRGGVAKLLQRAIVPPGLLSSLVALPFIPMAAA